MYIEDETRNKHMNNLFSICVYIQSRNLSEVDINESMSYCTKRMCARLCTIFAV